MPIDEFDTPPLLAAKIIQVADGLCCNEPRTVADFAVGTGELLAAAKLRWPNTAVFGCDISSERVSNITQARPDWTIAQCDFLDCSSRNSLSSFEIIKSRVDLAVLNPPFSARGGTKVEVEFGGQNVRCSPAMAFVLLASQYLKSDGKLVALLPAGVLEADRDHEAREALRQIGEFRAIHQTTGKFPGGSLNVTITYLKRGPATSATCVVPEPKMGDMRSSIKVLRGTLQTNQVPVCVEGERTPLVHSTELQGYELQLGQIEVPSGTRSISGPAVLIHRVGRPRKDKIAHVSRGSPFAITDCVIALLCPNEQECLRLHRSLIEHFSLLEKNYIGSGAPYITIKRVQRVLHNLGFASEVANWKGIVPIA